MIKREIGKYTFYSVKKHRNLLKVVNTETGEILYKGKDKEHFNTGILQENKSLEDIFEECIVVDQKGVVYLIEKDLNFSYYFLENHFRDRSILKSHKPKDALFAIFASDDYGRPEGEPKAWVVSKTTGLHFKDTQNAVNYWADNCNIPDRGFYVARKVSENKIREDIMFFEKKIKSLYSALELINDMNIVDGG